MTPSTHRAALRATATMAGPDHVPGSAAWVLPGPESGFAPGPVGREPLREVGR